MQQLFLTTIQDVHKQYTVLNILAPQTKSISTEPHGTIVENS